MTEESLREICKILSFDTHKIIDHRLEQCRITNKGIPSISNGLTYTSGTNKIDKLYNSFAEEFNKTKSFDKVYQYIEKTVAPESFTQENQRENYNNLIESLNKILILNGKLINLSGKIEDTVKAKTLDEVDRRVDSLAKKLYERKIHVEVQKYCRKDLLRKNYFEAVFEAAKGMAERVRTLTGLTTDGTELFQTAFNKDANKTYLFFNTLTTDSEQNEQNGLKELMNSIFHLVRNPQAHTPKINWIIEEDKALDILTLISFAHKYLDNCNKMPGK